MNLKRPINDFANLELMYSNDADNAAYREAVAGLPSHAGFAGRGLDKYGVPIPYSTGPHSLRCIREVCEVVDPSSILEIGFNIGCSSSMWLSLSKANVVSVDISDKDETLAAAKYLGDKYPGRFEFFCCDSKKVLSKLAGRKFDLAFIDGGHLYEDVMNDIDVCKRLGIPMLCFDDWMPQFGPGVQPAIAKYKLKVLGVMGNIALAQANW